jgi:hypothetical protein
MNDLKELIKQFMPFAQEQMGFDRPPRLFLRQDDENAANPLGKTGFYDPQAESITIYVAGRHPKDILRSLAHELMHHTQKCNGDFDNAESEGMGEQGYAQNNIHMRTMEIQAYQASIVFRDWEDSLKETIYYEHLQKGANKTMSIKEWKNGELTTLLSEAWGFNFDLQPLNETGAKDTGASTGDESKTDPGEEDYTTKKGDKTKKDKKAFDETINEDSEYEEDEHDKRNRDADDAHISAIEHHLDALKHDRDYEEDHIEEVASSSGRQSPHKDRRGDDKRKRPMEESDDSDESVASNPRAKMGEEQIREVARRVIARLKESKKNG